MKLEIITTGDEVVNGIIVNTNSSWIADKCYSVGHEIVRHTSVCDDTKDIMAALKASAKRADAVVVTGGLGPTVDDITIEAAAKAFKVKLIKNLKVVQEIKEFFARVGRPMSPSNEKQAYIPKGATVLKNLVGTAPGVMAKLGGATFFFLPGVPKELYQIFDDSVVPWLAKKSKGVMQERVLRCFGIPEASIDDKLKGVELFGTRLSFRVKFPEILLKVVARAKTLADAKRAVDNAADAIRERLGVVVYAEGETSLSKVVGRMLAKNKFTLSIAESCTGGLIASEITNVAGSSEYFERGVVSYSNTSKQELLGVSVETLRAHGAVSRETAMAMAEGIRAKSGTTFGLSVTGIAGPGGGTSEKPVGLVFIALASPDGTWAFEYRFTRDRLWFKSIVTAQALDLLRKHLLGVSSK